MKYKHFFGFLAFFVDEEVSDFVAFLLFLDLVSFFFRDSDESFFCRLFLAGGSSSSSLSDNASNNFSSKCNCCSRRKKTKTNRFKDFSTFNTKSSSLQIK